MQCVAVRQNTKFRFPKFCYNNISAIILNVANKMEAENIIELILNMQMETLVMLKNKDLFVFSIVTACEIYFLS